MIFKLRHLAAAAALATAAGSALAADAFPSPLNVGTVGSTPVSVFANAAVFNPSTFSYSFTLDSATGFSDLAGALRFWDPVDLTVSLVGPSFSQSVSVAGSVNIANAFGFSGLADGNYVISFTGLSTSSSSSFGGGYIQAIAAVPEPESMAMVLAGLGVAGMLLRRRKTV